MQQPEIYRRLTTIFEDTFDEDSIELTPETTAHDIKGWDSVAHINLIVAIEEEFHIKLKTAELESLKDVGEMVRLIESKTR
jgi:acyl carrier protein